jgi:hypothetical protein
MTVERTGGLGELPWSTRMPKSDNVGGSPTCLFTMLFSTTTQSSTGWPRERSAASRPRGPGPIQPEPPIQPIQEDPRCQQP